MRKIIKGFGNELKTMNDFYAMDADTFLRCHGEHSDAEYNATIVAEFAKVQRQGKFYPCPRCGSAETMRYDLLHNALSRAADVYVCPTCGTCEALEDYLGVGEDNFANWRIVTSPEVFLPAFAEHC